MPSPTHQTYRTTVRLWILFHLHEPDVPETLEKYVDAMLVLWDLDLEPARPILMRGYAKKPRGTPPRDPVVMLRCVLLSVLLGRPYNAWVRDLRASRFLRLLCGLDPDETPPGVGTFVDFFNRLHNEQVRDCACGCRLSPATVERNRAASPQPKKGRPAHEASQKTKGQPTTKKTKKTKQINKKRDVAARLVEQLRTTEDAQNPNDLTDRLTHLLWEVAVVPSTDKGLLGAPADLIVCGDGSSLVTGGAAHGKRTCDCPKTTRCDCDRIYSDPDAAWGYDTYRKRHFFGHHIYELTVTSQGHDLPIGIRLDPGNESDFTASLHALDRCQKLLRDHHPDMHIGTVILDAGHDGEAIYRYVLDHGAVPVIPLAKDAPAVHPQRPDLSLSSRGVPLCPAGCEMTPWGSAGPNRRLFACPVKAGTIDTCPNAPKDNPAWVCRPGAAKAPIVNLSIDQNPRLCPPIPRTTKQFQTLYKLRSGNERTFGVKKATFNLQGARHRKKSFWLIRLHLMAILQHAKAWVVAKNAADLLEDLTRPGSAEKNAA